MNLMKLSFNRKFLTAITLLSTATLGMESLQAATIPIDIAVSIPGQTNVTSTNVALKKKIGTRKKLGAKKKPATKKPEGVSGAPDDAMKKPEETPGQGAPGTSGQDSTGGSSTTPGTSEVPNQGTPAVPGQGVPGQGVPNQGIPGQDAPKTPGDPPKN
jgi:hypothetical protein